jgi:hypothetical protein
VEHSERDERVLQAAPDEDRVETFIRAGFSH